MASGRLARRRPDHALRGPVIRRARGHVPPGRRAIYLSPRSLRRRGGLPLRLGLFRLHHVRRAGRPGRRLRRIPGFVPAGAFDEPHPVPDRSPGPALQPLGRPGRGRRVDRRPDRSQLLRYPVRGDRPEHPDRLPPRHGGRPGRTGDPFRRQDRRGELPPALHAGARLPGRPGPSRTGLGRRLLDLRRLVRGQLHGRRGPRSGDGPSRAAWPWGSSP